MIANHVPSRPRAPVQKLDHKLPVAVPKPARSTIPKQDLQRKPVQWRTEKQTPNKVGQKLRERSIKKMHQNTQIQKQYQVIDTKEQRLEADLSKIDQKYGVIKRRIQTDKNFKDAKAATKEALKMIKKEPRKVSPKRLRSQSSSKSRERPVWNKNIPPKKLPVYPKPSFKTIQEEKPSQPKF